MTTLATFRTKVLDLLDDSSGNLYANAQVDAALRLALSDYSAACVLIRTYSFTTDGLRRIVLPADFIATSIIRVEIPDDDDPSNADAINFTPQYWDEQWLIETPDQIVDEDEVLSIYYTSPHFIDGLDSAAGTTIPDSDDNILAIGAAGYAALLRSTSRTEANLLTDVTIQELQDISKRYLDYFQAALRKDHGFSVAAWDLDTDKKY